LSTGNENVSAADAIKKPSIGLRTYFAVWSLLLFLTAATVTMAKLELGAITIIAVLAIATVKSVLVLLYFMHLRHEKRLIITLLIPGVIVLLAIFISLTYTDVMTRY
jgi:cytochrome c oxidase subunit IV